MPYLRRFRCYLVRYEIEISQTGTGPKTLAKRLQLMRTGLLGGSFNPAHGGHRKVSLFAMEALGLDEIW